MVQGIVTPRKSNTPEEERDLYQTPKDIFALISKIHGPFAVDGAANSRNHLCDLWMGPGSPLGIENALIVEWGKIWEEGTRIFFNPPWSRGNIYAFMKKANEEHRNNKILAILLLPATTDVAWFHEFVWDARFGIFHPWVRVDFISPRVRYIRPDGTEAKNPGIGSMVVSFQEWDTFNKLWRYT